MLCVVFFKTFSLQYLWINFPISSINHQFTSLQSASVHDSLVGTFCFKPFDANVDWSLVAKASPCYVTVCFCYDKVITSSKVYLFTDLISLAVSKGRNRSNYKILPK